MPVMADTAAIQFFTEAMRANTSALEGFREEARLDRALIHEIHVKITKLEAHDIPASLKELAAKIDALETKEDRRHGARSLGNWLIEKLPAIAAIIVAVVVGILATLKATGRI